MSTLISVPAGRSFRRQGTNWVDPQPEKGLIELAIQDELMNLWWKDRNTGAVQENLIVFPGEATFEKVHQDTTGRTHILKFSSSDQKYFFWFQNQSSEGDLRAEVDINALLQDPSYRPGSAALPERPSTPQAAPEERSYPPTPGAPRLSYREPGPPASASASSAPADDQAAQSQTMARLLAEWARSGGLGEVHEDAHLTDVLSSANMGTLLRNDPQLLQTLAPLLPPDLHLSSAPTAEELLPILSAPQFTDAIASLDNALRNGGLPGSMMVELGLPESAGQGVAQFLQGLKGLGQSSTDPAEDERMEQD